MFELPFTCGRLAQSYFGRHGQEGGQKELHKIQPPCISPPPITPYSSDFITAHYSQITLQPARIAILTSCPLKAKQALLCHPGTRPSRTWATQVPATHRPRPKISPSPRNQATVVSMVRRRGVSNSAILRISVTLAFTPVPFSYQGNPAWGLRQPPRTRGWEKLPTPLQSEQLSRGGSPLLRGWVGLNSRDKGMGEKI